MFLLILEEFSFPFSRCEQLKHAKREEEKLSSWGFISQSFMKKRKNQPQRKSLELNEKQVRDEEIRYSRCCWCLKRWKDDDIHSETLKYYILIFLFSHEIYTMETYIFFHLLFLIFHHHHLISFTVLSFIFLFYCYRCLVVS